MFMNNRLNDEAALIISCLEVRESGSLYIYIYICFAQGPIDYEYF